MARRSPYNDRYRKEGNVGSTRRSASSAKPKRKVAEPSGPTKAKAKKPSPNRAFLDAPEVKRYNRFYLILFGIAIVSLLPMLLGPAVFKVAIPQTVQSIMWGIYAAAIGGALYLQAGPLRKLKAAALRGELPSQQQGAGAKGKADAQGNDTSGDHGKDA